MAGFLVPEHAGIPITCASPTNWPNPGDFPFTFAQSINNEKGDLLLSLLQCSFTYKINNITAADNNNLFVYQPPPDVTTPDGEAGPRAIEIEDGMYSINQFRSIIENSLKTDGFWADEKGTGVATSPISVQANAALGKVVILIKKGWTVSMSDNYKGMASFLGFSTLNQDGEPNILTATEGDEGDYQLFTGDLLPDINRGRMAFNLHCNLIAGSGFSSGKSNDVLATIIPNVGINETVIYNNVAPIRIPINPAYRQISEIHFRLTDQYNRPIIISGDPTVVVLSLSRAGGKS